ncbi:50S ribosomal protein L6 [Candidatus Adlerbacteria bacterium RIFCSPHIGHO2_02_FULL_54_18]|uniref:Large ribosomal subunit protein uL6 n=2 Tax=Candidatus Adleribacteriota TaxID=1752736 RepID=A0A1F4Y1R5_9BACT|nr:MAG: 50S ribosomal protein L6 [Candidatus Adlerbacteria bacterium RIFCSPLOWO2_01_FULL_54_21b]OGC87889.1 MAG: 50S ribosomal protein L6 [Candidatus Adlerbacteria bacterium RIFCSPHIGHO2_02_FULL_54_18]
MSRLAKRPIAIPPKTEVTVSGGIVAIKGPKGSLQKPLHRLVSVEVGQEGVQVSQKGESIQARALVGTYASHVRNMLLGVNAGFSKKLLVEGVGFKWEVQGRTLALSLGFSHPVKMAIPEGLTVTAEKNTLMIAGFDKEVVGQFAADVRAHKKPEPYKGKGIRYEGEVVRRKQGKKAA